MGSIMKSSGARLRILGCGEAFDDELGNNSCLLEERSRAKVLFDCGYVTHVSRAYRARAARAIDRLARRDPRWFLPVPGDFISLE